MNLLCSVFSIWPIFGLWLLAASAWRVQPGIANWGSGPQVWHGPNTHLYQSSSLYNLKYEAQPTNRAMPFQNAIGSKRTIPQNWNAPKTIPLYGSSPKMKISTSASRFQNGDSSRHYVPRIWGSTEPNLYQRPFYGPKRKTQASALIPSTNIGNRRNMYRNWKARNFVSHQRPVYAPNQTVRKTNFPFRLQHGIGNEGIVPRNWNVPKPKFHQKYAYGQFQLPKSGGNLPPNWNGQKASPYRRQSYSSSHNVRMTSSPFLPKNGIVKGHNIRRNWIPVETDHYHVPFYASKAITPNARVMMRTRVPITPPGGSISPSATGWLSTIQRNRIPHTRKLNRIPVRAFVSFPEIDIGTPGLTVPRLTNNYQQREFTMQRKLEPEPSQDLNNLYNNGDAALENVVAKGNPSESNLIPESVSNQQATSRTRYMTAATEEEQRPVPRTSYVTTSYIGKESSLNDPNLIKLTHILRNMKKRSSNETEVEGDNYFGDDVPRTEARWLVSNDTSIFDKRNMDNERDKKSSIRKVKGRWNWGILNEFTPNFRLATMILLKQKRHNIRKRTLEEFNNPVQNSPEKGLKGTLTSNEQIKTVSSSKKHNESEISPSSSPEHVSFNMHYGKRQGKRKRNKQKHARNFINEKGDEFYFRPSKTYLNRQFSPFEGMGNTERYEPYFNTRQPFQGSQMAMAERMRAMRSRGLFHSLGNINPQFFSKSPFRFPLMPMPQQFIAMQRYGLPLRNFPSPYRRRPALPQTQDYFGAPWNMPVPNRMTETQERENNNVETTPQDSYDQPSVQPTMERIKSPISSQIDKGKYTDSFQSPMTEQSSQILKIENNRAFEGHPIVNTESFDASNQGLNGKNTNLQLTGLQVTDQSATMLNKWYPIRTGKVSLISDPRKFSPQWPSSLPGLDLAAINKLQTRGYFPTMNNPAMFNGFYQNNEQTPESSPYEEEDASNGNYMESANGAFSRGNQISPPMQGFGLNGMSGQRYFPSPVPYPTIPFNSFSYKSFPNYSNGRVLRKREVRRGTKSAHSPEAKKKLFKGQFSDGSIRNRKSRFSNSGTTRRGNHMSTVKKANITRAHLNGTNINNRKEVISEHSSRIGRDKKGRSTPSFLNSKRYFMYSPKSFAFTPFYAVASDPRTQLIYPVGDPMNEIVTRGYSVARRSYGTGISAPVVRWLLPITGVGSTQRTERFPLLSFPVGPPQSLMELSQKVDQFPTEDFASSGGNVEADTQRQASVIDNGHLSSTEEEENRPNTVSAALNLMSAQDPMESSEQPSMRKPRGGPSAENENDQKGSNIVTSSSSYSLNANGFPGIFQQSIPEFAGQGLSEISEEGSLASVPENEQFQQNEQGLGKGGESYTQGDNAIDDGSQDVPEGSESNFAPGLLDGLDSMQAGLLNQQFGGFSPIKGGVMGNFHTIGPYQKGRKRPPPANRLSSSERQRALLRQNAMADQKELLQPRATFSTKENIQGDIPGNVQGNSLGATTPGTNSHMLSLPNLSLNTIEKLINSAVGEQSPTDFKTGAGHGYGSRLKGSAAEKITDENLGDHDSSGQTSVSDLNTHDSLKGNGKYVQNFDWKSPLMSQSQSPSDFNWKLERALTQWKEPLHPSRDTANTGGNLPGGPPDRVFVPPKGSNDNPDVVPGYTFDTHGQRSGPLFLPNPPPELRDDSSAETVLMVPSSGNKTKGEKESAQSDTKKETISKRMSKKKKKTA